MFHPSTNLDQMLCLKVIKYISGYDYSGVLIPLPDIVNYAIDFCGWDTMIIPPAPTPWETNTQNVDLPKNKHKRRNKSKKLEDSQKVLAEKSKTGQKFNQRKKSYHWYIVSVKYCTNQKYDVATITEPRQLNWLLYI